MTFRGKVDPPRTLGVKVVLRALGPGPGIFLGLLLLIWVGLPLVPEETGLRFGMGYRVFFTAMLLLGAVFFWFLGKERIPQPQRPARVLASVAGVYLLTVGALVAAGVVYPQFPLPQPPSSEAQDASKRGEDLFWGSSIGCFRCHSVRGTGGTRGPDLTEVASRASQRVPGLSAEQYLREKITAGMTYQYQVPEYTPMMPPFGRFVPKEQIEDLVAYLLSVSGGGKALGE